MNCFSIECDFLKMDLKDFGVKGVEIARLEVETDRRVISLETTETDGKIALIIADYSVDREDGYHVNGHSEPFFTMPRSTREVEDMLWDWYEEKMKDFSGTKIDQDEHGFAFWVYQNGNPIQKISPYFPSIDLVIEWGEKEEVLNVS